MSVMNWLKGGDRNDVSVIFNNDKKQVSAVDAYKQSRYGNLKTDRQILEDFFTDVWSLIDELNHKGMFMGFVELKDDIEVFIPQILEKMRHNHYFAMVIDSNTVISNKLTNETCDFPTDSKFLWIAFNKQVVAKAMTFEDDMEETPETTVDSSVPTVTSGNDDKDLKPLNS